MATCPDCEFDDINLDEYEHGDTMSCSECGRTLVVSGDGLDFADKEDDGEDKDGNDLVEKVLDDDNDEDDDE
jgi:hypothetical protein